MLTTEILKQFSHCKKTIQVIYNITNAFHLQETFLIIIHTEISDK